MPEVLTNEQLTAAHLETSARLAALESAVLSVGDTVDRNTELFLDTISRIDVRSLAIKLVLVDILMDTVVKGPDGNADWDKYIDSAMRRIKASDEKAQRIEASKLETIAPPEEEAGTLVTSTIPGAKIFTGD